RQNLLGIHESSDKALKIMIATTIMAVVMLLWCGGTLVVQGPANRNAEGGWVPPPPPHLARQYEPGVFDPKTRAPRADERSQDATWKRDAKDPRRLEPKRDAAGQPEPKMSEALGKLGIQQQEDPLGLLGRTGWAEGIRNPPHWLSLLGILGLFISFGH